MEPIPVQLHKFVIMESPFIASVDVSNTEYTNKKCSPVIINARFVATAGHDHDDNAVITLVSIHQDLLYYNSKDFDVELFWFKMYLPRHSRGDCTIILLPMYNKMAKNAIVRVQGIQKYSYLSIHHGCIPI